MKPVEKGPAPKTYSAHSQAKIDLLAKLGYHCSYCEAGKVPQDLDVEHIYPKDPHPSRRLLWSNFLLSCSSCNSKKNGFLGSGRQKGLIDRFVWPHHDNTFKAFRYFSDGRVEVRPRLRSAVKKKAEATMKMVGLSTVQIKAKAYKKRLLPYDGISIREEYWKEVEWARRKYLTNPSRKEAAIIAKHANRAGFFSIWMEVFHDRPEVRQELIKAFQADPKCFNRNTTQPKKKGRL